MPIKILAQSMYDHRSVGIGRVVCPSSNLFDQHDASQVLGISLPCSLGDKPEVGQKSSNKLSHSKAFHFIHGPWFSTHQWLATRQTCAASHQKGIASVHRLGTQRIAMET